MGACACPYARLFPNFPLEGLDFNDYYVETSHAPLVGAIANFDRLGSWAPRFRGWFAFNYEGLENEENHTGGSCSIGAGDLCQ